MGRVVDLSYDDLLVRAKPFLHLRALEPLTGAMVALVPTAADAARLVVDGGEPVDQMHVTLAYLGTATDIPVDVQAAVIDRMRSLVQDAILPDFTLPLAADGFALSLFNPGDAVDRQTCIVLGLSGADLDAVHTLVEQGLGTVPGLVMPEQISPWAAHLTLIYTDNTDMITELVDRVGPVKFDRLRVAFAGVNADIPLVGAGGPSYGRAIMSGDLGVRLAVERFLRGLPELPPVPGASLIQNGQG